MKPKKWTEKYETCTDCGQEFLAARLWSHRRARHPTEQTPSKTNGNGHAKYSVFTVSKDGVTLRCAETPHGFLIVSHSACEYFPSIEAAMSAQPEVKTPSLVVVPS